MYFTGTTSKKKLVRKIKVMRTTNPKSTRTQKIKETKRENELSALLFVEEEREREDTCFKDI